MKPLVIGDKEYQAVQYKDGWIWVDKTAERNPESWYTDGIDVYKDSKIMPPENFELIIAQTPDVGLDGVPCVEVLDFVLAFIKNIRYEIKRYDAVNPDERNLWVERMIDNFEMAYKAAQSKGCYTEEQVQHAIRLADKNDSLTGDQIIEMVQPKLVVEMEETTTWVDANYGMASKPIVHLKPVTYQKDGKTYFKLI